jgi:hypothetical protein
MSAAGLTVTLSAAGVHRATDVLWNVTVFCADARENAHTSSKEVSNKEYIVLFCVITMLLQKLQVFHCLGYARYGTGEVSLHFRLLPVAGSGPILLTLPSTRKRSGARQFAVTGEIGPMA